MCYNCGCKLPYEDHGDSNNLVEEHMKKAGKTKAMKQAGKTTAKENVLELLQLQKDKGELANPKKDYN